MEEVELELALELELEVELERHLGTFLEDHLLRVDPSSASSPPSQEADLSRNKPELRDSNLGKQF